MSPQKNPPKTETKVRLQLSDEERAAVALEVDAALALGILDRAIGLFPEGRTLDRKTELALALVLRAHEILRKALGEDR